MNTAWNINNIDRILYSDYFITTLTDTTQARTVAFRCTHADTKTFTHTQRLIKLQIFISISFIRFYRQALSV